MHYDDTRKQEMWDWFHSVFVQPDQCAPRLSEEYGYENVCGGTFQPSEILEKEFAGKYPMGIIGEVASDIEGLEGAEWTKAARYEYN